MSFGELVLAQWQLQSIGEIFAVFFAVAYVWLAAEQSLWCWPAGFISTALFAYVYWDVTLFFFQMLLNIYYMGMAVFGFISWRRQGESKINISKMSLYEHVYVIGIGTLSTLIVYVVSEQFFSYDLVLLDIGLTVFSLITTYLTVIKKLENWYYWTFINFVSIALLYDRGLYLTMLLMFVYIILAARGLIRWFAIYSEVDGIE